MYEVRWLNLEYIFYKIYDFFGSIFGSGSGNNGFGIGSPTHRTFWQWLSDTFTGTLSIVWIIAIIAFLIFFCLLIYTRLQMYDQDQIRKKKHDDHFVAPIPKELQAVNPRWEYIEKMFASANPNDWRVAIIEADTMLDELTIAMNIPGDNLGDRLKNLTRTQKHQPKGPQETLELTYTHLKKWYLNQMHKCELELELPWKFLKIMLD